MKADSQPDMSPSGGLVTWVDLGDGASSTRLAEAARRQGVRVSPGTRFTYRGTHDRFVRIPYTLPSEQLEDVVRRLARAADAAYAGRGSISRAAPLVWTA